MAVKPEKIGTHKSFNSFNTGQLEDTYKDTATQWRPVGLKEGSRGGPPLSESNLNIVYEEVTKVTCFRSQNVH